MNFLVVLSSLQILIYSAKLTFQGFIPALGWLPSATEVGNNSFTDRIGGTDGISMGGTDGIGGTDGVGMGGTDGLGLVGTDGIGGIGIGGIGIGGIGIVGTDGIGGIVGTDGIGGPLSILPLGLW